MSQVPRALQPTLSCSIAMCRNYNNPYSRIDLYQLPSNPEQRRKFSEILGIPHSVAERDTARVCALHFKSKVLNMNNNFSPEYQTISAPVIPITKGPTIANVSPYATNANTFTIGPGQPIKFFLQTATSNTINSTPISTTSILKAGSLISSSASSILSTTSSISSPTSLILSSTSSMSSSTDKVVSELAILQEDKNVSLDEDSSNTDDHQEKRTDAQLDLQCDEELLSQSQLNSYYSDLVSFLTANAVVNKLPPQVKSATISTQTDPVTILITDQIHPQPSTSPTIKESSALNSAQSLPRGSSQIENKISLIELSPPTPVVDNTIPKTTQSASVKRSIAFSNSVQIPHVSSKENVKVVSSLTPRVSLASIPANSYTVTTVSPTTIPAPTVTTTTVSSADKSKLFSYLSQKPSVTVASVIAPPPYRINLKQPPQYVSSEKSQTIVPPLLKQVFSTSNFPSSIQSRILPPPAATTRFSLSNQSNRLVTTNSGPLTTTMPSGIPFQNQVRFEPNLPAYQMPQGIQLISLLSENPRTGTLSSLGNFSSSNMSDTPFQMLIQNDQPNLVYSNNFPVQGPTFTGFNTVTSSPSFPGPLENDSDKDADLLGLCNVTTIYGSDTPPQDITPMDQTPYPKPNAAGDTQQTPTFGSVSENLAIADDTDNGSTCSGFESPHLFGSDSSQNSMGPFIVDVISATEGAKEYYIGDKMPNILLDKGKKDVMDKRKKDENQKHLTYIPDNKVYSAGDKVPNVLFCESKKDEENKKESQINCSKDNKVDSTDVQKNTNAPIQTVQLHNSIFSLQTSIPIIPNGSQPCRDAQTLLSLKIPIGTIGKDDGTILRHRLRAEKYITCSVWWLVRRNYMPMVDPCSCKSHAFKINRSAKHVDGYCWKCANLMCRKEEPIKRPKFFESFKTYTLEELLLLTYHWACQTPIEDILLEVKMTHEKVLAYFQGLQELCHLVSLKKCKLGTTPNTMVEAALVKLGNFFVIGAYDRKTHYTRLEAISQLDAYNTTVHIQRLKNWLCPNTVLVTDQKISEDFLKGIVKLSAYPSVKSPLVKEAHVLNISKYLINSLTSVFGKVNQNDLNLETVKGFLHELQWRRKYGKFLDMSFWSIMNHIRDLNDKQKVRITAKPGELGVNAYSKKMKVTLRTRWGPITNEDEAKPVEKSKGDKPAVTLATNVQASTKSYSKATQPPPAAAAALKTILPKTYVIVTNASELFLDVPEIPGGSSNVNSKALLAIKIRCEDSSPPGVYKPNATSLGLQLRTEGFISDPVKWLVKRGYVSGFGPCYVCGDKSLLRENPKYKDGCSWSCQNRFCKFENMFRRPLFFARFNEQSMAQIAAMIFHWTVQSDYNIVTSDVPLDSVKISHAWRAFQVLCSSALKRDHFRVGGESQIVEVALVQYGRLYILGARHRQTKRTLLKCFPVEITNQKDLVLETLRKWIVYKSFVVVNMSPLFDIANFYQVFSANTSITDVASTNFHVLNITSYLLKHVFEMFGHLRADLVKPQLMQMYLDELMWRERFGKLPNLAFAKIMFEIFYHEKHSTSLLDQQVKELLVEEPTTLCLKQAVVILQRIPQTVLKYYNCLPADSGTQKAPSIVKKRSRRADSSSDISSEESSSSGDELLSQVIKKSKDIVLRKKQITQGSKGGTNLSVKNSDSDEESSSSADTLDEESSWSEAEDSKQGNSSLHKINNRKISRLSNSPVDPSEAAKKLVLPNTTKALEVVSDLPADDVPVTNSVQPLVIKMNKNCNKIQSYLKSEFLKAKYKKQRSRRFNVRRLSRKKPKKKSDSNAAEAVISDVVVKTEVEEEPGPSGLCQSVNSDSAGGAKWVKRRSAVLRRLENSDKQVCIECGKEVNFEHFMKQFSCTDCPNFVYTTCCGTAFFEHRSALLFGKRMLRRDKVGHGLHRSRTLSHLAVCPCGFKSKLGNQIASHLVKCQQTSCFYNGGS